LLLNKRHKAKEHIKERPKEMNKQKINNLFFITIILLCYHTSHTQNEWWKRNNLRVIQLNLPDYEAANIQPKEIVEDLVNYSANTLIINAGGIMAFYPSKLESHYINPYMRPGVMRAIINDCHKKNIKVIEERVKKMYHIRPCLLFHITLQIIQSYRIKYFFRHKP
jgi:hypothetical protein